MNQKFRAKWYVFRIACARKLLIHFNSVVFLSLCAFIYDGKRSWPNNFISYKINRIEFTRSFRGTSSRPCLVGQEREILRTKGAGFFLCVQAWNMNNFILIQSKKIFFFSLICFSALQFVQWSWISVSLTNKSNKFRSNQITRCWFCNRNRSVSLYLISVG